MESLRGLLALGMSLLLASASAPSVEAMTEQPPSVARSAEGGHAILLEQYTASWCDICKVVDPRVDEIVEDTSSRVARLAFHPNDSDPMGQQLTSERLFRHGNPAETPLPTLWFDGDSVGSGDLTSWQIYQGLLGAESARGASSEMTVERLPSKGSLLLTISVNGNHPGDTMLSIFLKDPMVWLDRAYEDVVVGWVQVPLNQSETSSSEGFMIDDMAQTQHGATTQLELTISTGDTDSYDLEVVVVHESPPGEDAETYGVVSLEMDFGKKGWVPSAVLPLGLLFLSTLVLATIRKKW